MQIETIETIDCVDSIGTIGTIDSKAVFYQKEFNNRIVETLISDCNGTNLYGKCQ